MIPRIAITLGEPAGVGPELVARVAQHALAAELIAVGDGALLAARAALLDLPLELEPFDASAESAAHRPGALKLLSVPLAVAAEAGKLDTRNAAATLAALDAAIDLARGGVVAAIVTPPLHKGVINDAGVPFSGHTERLAEKLGAAQPVMLLMAGRLRVALLTTHLPLRAVPDAVTAARLTAVLEVLHRELSSRFGIEQPRIAVLGLNPHAGEGGHLGREELEVIAPVLVALRAKGMDLRGPLPADTAFTPAALADCDAVLAMYHDQGLPVLKHAGFGRAVNLTLGLPIVRTSVDHGTALDLAGTGKADASSLEEALATALALITRGSSRRRGARAAIRRRSVSASTSCTSAA
jgi:4-hydroxythreonine-4-phosphate dehydrogenase